MKTPGRCIAKGLGDLTYLRRRILQHLPGDLEARLLEELLEADTGRIEPAIQGATVHPDERGDLIGLDVTRQDRRMQQCAHLRREVVVVAVLERIDLICNSPRRVSSMAGRRRFRKRAENSNVYSSASKRNGTRKNLRNGPTSVGALCANQTSVGLQSGPHSSCMMLYRVASAPSPV